MKPKNMKLTCIKDIKEFLSDLDPDTSRVIIVVSSIDYYEIISNEFNSADLKDVLNYFGKNYSIIKIPQIAVWGNADMRNIPKLEFNGNVLFSFYEFGMPEYDEHWLMVQPEYLKR
jgi:hypothetical protein